jgi:maltose O-acetyltransferase
MKVPGSIPTWFREVFINGIIEGVFVPRAMRWVLLRMVGIDTQRATFAAKICFTGRKVKVGKYVSINEYVFLGAWDQITLGDYVGLGARCSIITATHEITNVNLRHGPVITAPVTIGAGSMIGSGSTILAGVTIGEGVVVGAGSVVVKDLEPNAVYVGNPARLVRRLEPIRFE